MENNLVQLKVTSTDDKIPIWGTLVNSMIPYRIGVISVEEGELVLRSGFYLSLPIIRSNFTFEITEIKPENKKE